MKPRNDTDVYLAASPFLHSSGKSLVFEVVVSDDVGCSEILEILFNIGEVFPTEAWLRKGSWDQRCKIHLFRMILIVFNPHSLASVITACPTYVS